MRLFFRVSIVGILIASLAGAPLLAGPSRAVGVVLQADHARLSGGDVANGATVFDGDRLTTEDRGMSRLRVGPAQLYLMGNTGVLMRQISDGAGAVVEQGTVVWSVAAGQPFELRASQATIRAKAGQPAVGQVSVLGSSAFTITSNRGELEVTIDEETRVVSEGTSYRVELDPEPQGSGRPPRRAGRSKFIWIPLLAVGGVTAYFVSRAVVSPTSQ